MAPLLLISLISYLIITHSCSEYLRSLNSTAMYFLTLRDSLSFSMSHGGICLGSDGNTSLKSWKIESSTSFVRATLNRVVSGEIHRRVLMTGSVYSMSWDDCSAASLNGSVSGSVAWIWSNKEWKRSIPLHLIVVIFAAIQPSFILSGVLPMWTRLQYTGILGSHH